MSEGPTCECSERRCDRSTRHDRRGTCAAVSSAPAVSVVVLSWNRRQDTLDCLASLAGVTYPAISVICVDNGSSDGSPDAVAVSFPDIRLVRLDANTGFAAGMNTGIRVALEDGAEHVLTLNNDMVVATSVVEPLVGAVTGDPQAAAACSQVPSRIPLTASGMPVPHIGNDADTTDVTFVTARNRFTPALLRT